MTREDIHGKKRTASVGMVTRYEPRPNATAIIRSTTSSQGAGVVLKSPVPEDAFPSLEGYSEYL